MKLIYNLGYFSLNFPSSFSLSPNFLTLFSHTTFSIHFHIISRLLPYFGTQYSISTLSRLSQYDFSMFPPIIFSWYLQFYICLSTFQLFSFTTFYSTSLAFFLSTLNLSLFTIVISLFSHPLSHSAMS